MRRVVRMVDMGSAYKSLVQKPICYFYKDNINMSVKEVGYEGVLWIRLDQSMSCQWLAFVNTLMN